MKMTKNTVRYIIGVLLLMVLIMLTLAFANYRNRVRNFEQVGRYIDELSENTAKHVADVFADKRASIDSIAYLYGNAIETTAANLELLAGLEEKSGFDRIRFVAADGTDYTSDGSTTNLKDREYFIRGMAGETGICEVLQSRINGEKQIGFYAPVYFEGEICGIAVGFLTESTVSDILDTNLYDFPADTLIFRQDGVVLGRYLGEGTLNISRAEEASTYVDAAHRAGALAAIEKQENYQFTFTGPTEQSVGYVVPIAGTQWSLVQVFPADAADIVMATTHKDSTYTFITMTVIFACFIVFLIYTYSKDAKVRSEALARNKVNLVMRGVSEDYLCLIDVDLATQKEVRYILSKDSGFDNWTSENYNDYTGSIEEYAKAYVAEYDRERFLMATRLPVLQEVLAKQNAFYIEYDAVIGGNTLKLQGKFALSDDKQFENHMLISIRDITETTRERNAKEKELSDARVMAESANKAKTTFLFNMSHDIRTPINAIMGYTTLLEKNADDREKQKDYIEKIKYSGGFLLSLINNVLEMARIESGKMVLDEVIWDIGQFDAAITSVFEEQFKQKKLNFSKQLNITHTHIFCDVLKLKQVYFNILSNAVKYTPEGGSISMTLEELPSETEGVGIFRSEISDTGIGMSEEFLSHIFEEFTRESTATESKIAGSGLGMSIAKKLVEFMGGKIEVKSRVGEGTTFTMTIPHRIAGESDVEELHNSAREYTDAAFANKRILLAEDNDMNAEIAEEILGDAGFKVERAKDGCICVRMLREAADDYYDIILMDIQMPNMNGYDATREIRQLDGKKAEIPIIAMTANAFEEDRRNAFDAGMNEHIAKPIEIPKLMDMLAKLLKETSE